MKGPAVFTCAVRSVIRNRRTTASALVGIILGVAIAVAPWVSLDSSVRGLVDYYLEGLPYDLTAIGARENLDAAAAALQGVPDVSRVEPVVLGWGDVNGSATGHSEIDGGHQFYFVRDSFAAITSELGIRWDGLPSLGTLMVDVSLRDAGLRPGDSILVERRVPVFGGNGTVIGEEVRNTSFMVGGFYWAIGPVQPFSASLMFSAFADVDGFATALNLTGLLMPGILLTWLDRASLLNPYDPSGSEARLRRELTLAENALLPSGYLPSYLPSYRGPSLQDIPAVVNTAASVLRLLFLALAVPTLAIAALLTKVGYEVGLASRRRELAVLRARGLSPRGVRFQLLVEALLIGTIGAILGLLLALGLSLLFSRGAFLPVGLPATELAVAPETALVALLLGSGLAFAVARTPARIAASENLVGTMKAFHAEEARISYRPSRDFLVAGVGAAGLLLLLAWGSVRDSPLSIATFLLGFSTALLAPAAPFLLVLAVARYLTRGTNRPYRAFARLLRPFLGELDVLVDRDLVRAPRRSSNTAMIVTFVVGFVFVMSVLVPSTEAYQEAQVLWSAPADLVAESADFVPGMFNASAVAAVRAVPGVAAATPVISTSSSRGNVILFDAVSYRLTVTWLRADDLGDVDPAALLDALTRGSAFAANPPFVAQLGLEPGDVLTFDGVFGGTATVGLYADVPRLPGLYDSSLFEQTATAYLSLSAVSDANLSGPAKGRYLVALASGADAQAIAGAISSVLGASATIRLREDVRREAFADPMAATVLGFLETQARLSVVVLVVAVALLVYSASLERRDELVTLIARGVEPRMANRLLMAEGWVVSLLGLLLGVPGGLVTAAMFLGLASALAPMPVPLVIPWTAAVPLAALLAGVWAAGFAGAASVRRMNVPRVLKLRGG